MSIINGNGSGNNYRGLGFVRTKNLGRVSKVDPCLTSDGHGQSFARPNPIQPTVCYTGLGRVGSSTNSSIGGSDWAV